MFETSVVQAQVQTRGRFNTLSVSIFAHSAVIIGALALSIASVDFPKNSPKEYALAPIPVVLRIPPPLGTPNGGVKKTPVATPVKPAAPPTQPTAPAAVPETITNAEPAQSTIASDSTTPGTGTDNGPLGVPWGTKDSIGDLDAPPAPLDVPVAQPEEKIYQSYEVKAPVLVSRIDPRYPPALVRTAMAATVVVHCIIDKNGNVRDPQVINATMPPFEAEVLRVIPQWKYKPATYGGKAVDSYLNLTVTFQVRR
ncbi:MAG TPA: TonB family protein [Thermoanaerobaculia bacterium]|nr:TonB family protein [Thermoanaerobaculia bacterium]